MSHLGLSVREKYSVVEFLPEKEVEIVASSWLFENENQKMFSYWPPWRDQNRCSLAAKSCTVPEINWNSYECRLMCATGLQYAL